MNKSVDRYVNVRYNVSIRKLSGRSDSVIDFTRLESYRENNRLEAKKALGGLPESIWETYSAFANTSGGIILLGVREEKDRSLHAVNLPAPKSLVRELWEDLNNTQKVSVNILSEEDVSIKNLDGKKIIVINVPQAEDRFKPVYIGKDPFLGSYFRDGDGDFRCSEEEVRRMLESAERKEDSV